VKFLLSGRRADKNQGLKVKWNSGEKGVLRAELFYSKENGLYDTLARMGL